MRRENSNFNAQTTTQDAVKWFMHTSFWYEMFPWRSHCSIWMKSPNSTSNLLKFLSTQITVYCTQHFLQRRQRVYFRFLFCEVKSTLITKCAYSSFSECYKYGNDYWEDVCIMNRWMIDWSIMGYHRHSLHHTGAVNRSWLSTGPTKRERESMFAASLGCSC